jgi:putative copper resistance protein D
VAGAARALRRTARAAVACTALAAASLAWGGHAAASQGAAGLVRLGVDIAHLLAGLTWVGALALFAAKLWRIDAGHSATTQQLAHQLGRFAGVGSVLVGGLVISGVAHGLYLAPPAQIMAVARAPYGQLMALKLGLFAGMLALAMHNRFALVPALAQASTPHTRHRALAALRRSISLEAALALGVLWCVAVAGTLDPMGAN